MQSHSLVNLTPTALRQLLSLYLCFCAFQLPPMIVTVGAQAEAGGRREQQEQKKLLKLMAVLPSLCHRQPFGDSVAQWNGKHVT